MATVVVRYVVERWLPASGIWLIVTAADTLQQAQMALELRLKFAARLGQQAYEYRIAAV